MPTNLHNQIAELIRHLNDQPDKLHGDITPSTQKLAEIGIPALEQVLPLMLSQDRETRMRALRVIELITMREYGFRPGQGWLHADDESTWRRHWDSMGALTADTPASECAESVDRWMKWLRERQDQL